MDYTLAVYKSPHYEDMVYAAVIRRLVRRAACVAVNARVSRARPTAVVGARCKWLSQELLTLHYDAEFPIRGLVVDQSFGNLLKVGKFGELIRAFHGHTPLTKEVRRSPPCVSLATERRVSPPPRTVLRRQALVKMYPALQIHSDEIGARFRALDTLFALPECCLFADLVDLLERGVLRGASVRGSSALPSPSPSASTYPSLPANASSPAPSSTSTTVSSPTALATTASTGTAAIASAPGTPSASVMVDGVAAGPAAPDGHMSCIGDLSYYNLYQVRGDFCFYLCVFLSRNPRTLTQLQTLARLLFFVSSPPFCRICAKRSIGSTSRAGSRRKRSR